VLGQAMESLTATGGKFMQWFGGGKMEMVRPWRTGSSR